MNPPMIPAVKQAAALVGVKLYGAPPRATAKLVVMATRKPIVTANAREANATVVN